jgi:hypothetical protein
VRYPFPSKENRHIQRRDDLGTPVIPGGQEIGLGSRNLRPRAEAQPTGRAVSKERLGNWDGQMAVWAPLHPPRRATWPNGECGYSTRCHMLGPERQEAVLPGRALYLPTFSHFLIVNKALLSFPPQKVSILQDTRVLSHSLIRSLRHGS